MKTLDITVLQNGLDTIEDCIQHNKVINTDVSKVNVSWHLDHSLKVINSVIKNMQNSDSALYIDNFSFLGDIKDEMVVGFTHYTLHDPTP